MTVVAKLAKSFGWPEEKAIYEIEVVAIISCRIVDRHLCWDEFRSGCVVEWCPDTSGEGSGGILDEECRSFGHGK
jgi:hypothetical protein